MNKKACAKDYKGRFREIMADPLNKLIPRVENAGVVTDNILTMHNGIKIWFDEDTYYDGFSEISITNKGVHKPQEEYIFSRVLESLPANPAMVEIGSCWAFYPMWFLTRTQNGRAFLIATNKHNLEIGKRNFALNNLHGDFTQGEIGIDSFQIVDYLDNKNISDIDILHADIQGAEYRLLEDLKSYLERKKIKYIFISSHSQKLHYDCMNFLIETGYTIIATADLEDESFYFDGIVVAKASNEWLPEKIQTFQRVSKLPSSLQIADTKEKDAIFCSTVDRYKENLNTFIDRYKKYPRHVSIETKVVCNARCSFCPYQESNRKGQILKDTLFYKIINDLQEIPIDHKFGLTLGRINEPFLDDRLIYFSDIIAEKIPQARQLFWTNGTSLTEDNIECVKKYPNSVLNISLNYIDNEEHKRNMGFGVYKVLLDLDELKKKKDKGQFDNIVILHAIDFDDKKTVHFRNFCRDRWPDFKINIRPLFYWRHSNAGIDFDKDLKGEDNRKNIIENLGCGQWFDLHILANGFITHCCIDEQGFIDKQYNTELENVLAIYGHRKQLRESGLARNKIKKCVGCFHLG